MPAIPVPTTRKTLISRRPNKKVWETGASNIMQLCVTPNNCADL